MVADWGFTMVDFALQRLNMVESQIRPSELMDRRVADAMLSIARDVYLPDDLQSVAYSDGELPLVGSAGDGMKGREILAPRSIAQMLQALQLEADHVVLLVGVGTGYEVALAAQIAQTVVALEVNEALADAAEKVLVAEDVNNAAVVRGALEAGYADEGPYDAILINGCVDAVPEGLLDQLKDGGHLVAGRRAFGVCRIVRWQRAGDLYPTLEFAPMATVMLPGFEKKSEFVFA